MRITELDRLLAQVIVDSDHPEITAVEHVPTQERPDDHTRLKVHFASGASATVMVNHVKGPGIPEHAEYQLPKEAM